MTNSLPTGSYEDCSLATYTITVPGGGPEIELRSGPYVSVAGVEVLSPQSRCHHLVTIVTESSSYHVVTMWLLTVLVTMVTSD